jgi:hypothetical protein
MLSTPLIYDHRHGMFFALTNGMDRICQHCGESIIGNAYRVMSEEQGITLLDMIVCSLCFMEAKRLRLHTEEINVRGKQPSARNRGSHSSRLEV